MSVADATPDYEVGTHDDRAFLGHPKGLGFSASPRVRALLLLFDADAARALHGQISAAARPHGNVVGLGWLSAHLSRPRGPAARLGDLWRLHALVYLTPVLGGIIADKCSGGTRR